MRKPQRKPDRAAIARSLQQLEKLFGRRSPENGNAAVQSGAGNALLTGKLKHGGVR